MPDNNSLFLKNLHFSRIFLFCMEFFYVIQIDLLYVLLPLSLDKEHLVSLVYRAKMNFRYRNVLRGLYRISTENFTL